MNYHFADMDMCGGGGNGEKAELVVTKSKKRRNKKKEPQTLTLSHLNPKKVLTFYDIEIVK